MQDIKVDDVLTRENVRVIRRGFGFSTKYLEQEQGKTVNQDVKRGTALGVGAVLMVVENDHIADALGVGLGMVSK